MKNESNISVESIIEAINTSKVYSLYLLDDIDGFELVNKVATIDRDEHRWYTTATYVYALEGRFIGVNGLLSLKSEGMSAEDADVECKAFEMIEVPSVTYVAKK